MPGFSPVDPKQSFPELEERVLERWREGDVFDRQLASREGAEVWSFYEGPPTANGRPGSHHVLARVFKDVYPRYRAMCGYRVPRKAGWDCHGLPVEIEVEKELGISSKQEIEEYGIDKFNARCRESVFEYVEEWNRLTERIGFWIDLDDPYVTLEDDYIESVWWSLKQLWDEERALRGPQGRALLPALRHGALLARGGARLRGRRGPLDLRALPAAGEDGSETASRCWSGRRRPGRCPATSRWPSPPTSPTSRRVVEGEIADPRRAAGREGARRGGGDRSARLPGSELVGRHYEGPVFNSRRSGAGRLPGDRRRLRHHRGRHRPRPHRPRLRRGRLRGRSRRTGSSTRPTTAASTTRSASTAASTAGSPASRASSSRTRRSPGR